MDRHVIPLTPAELPTTGRQALPACIHDRCGSGDYACPCPEACQLPEQDEGSAIDEGDTLDAALAFMRGAAYSALTLRVLIAGAAMTFAAALLTRCG